MISSMKSPPYVGLCRIYRPKINYTMYCTVIPSFSLMKLKPCYTFQGATCSRCVRAALPLAGGQQIGKKQYMYIFLDTRFQHITWWMSLSIYEPHAYWKMHLSTYNLIETLQVIRASTVRHHTLPIDREILYQSQWKLSKYAKFLDCATSNDFHCMHKREFEVYTDVLAIFVMIYSLSAVTLLKLVANHLQIIRSTHKYPGLGL